MATSIVWIHDMAKTVMIYEGNTRGHTASQMNCSSLFSTSTSCIPDFQILVHPARRTVLRCAMLGLIIFKECLGSDRRYPDVLRLDLTSHKQRHSEPIEPPSRIIAVFGRIIHYVFKIALRAFCPLGETIVYITFRFMRADWRACLDRCRY